MTGWGIHPSAPYLSACSQCVNGMGVAREVKREQAEQAVWLLSRAGGNLRPPMVTSQRDLRQADVVVYLLSKLRNQGWAQAAAAHTPRGDP